MDGGFYRKPVAFLNLIRQVKDGGDTLLSVGSLKSVDAAFFLMAVQPGEPFRSIVAAKKGRMLQIEFVQILHKAMEGVMYGVFQDIPILLPLLIPFPQLSELISHKVQLLAWMGVHIHIQGTGLWKLLFILPVHFLEDGCFPVDDLIVG